MDEPKYKKVFSLWELKQIEKNIDLFEEKETDSNTRINFMNTDFIWGIIRHLLTMLAGILVTSGFLSADQVSQLVGAVMFLAMLAASIYSKITANKVVDVALKLPAGTSKEQLKKELNLR